MISVFGVLIYLALCSGERFDHHPGTGIMPTSAGAFELFTNIISDNMTNSLTILLLQIIVILLTVRVFSYISSQNFPLTYSLPNHWTTSTCLAKSG